MKFISMSTHLDGGTNSVETDQGIFYIDHRRGTTTPNRLFEGYPRDDNKNIISFCHESAFNDMIIELCSKHRSTLTVYNALCFEEYLQAFDRLIVHEDVRKTSKFQFMFKVSNAVGV
jgi:hypothetical protein